MPRQRIPKMLPVLVLCLTLLVPAAALAGGALGGGKKCGQTPVEGAYKKYCDTHYWTTENKYFMKCREAGMAKVWVECEKVEHCDFKIAIDAAGDIVCD